MAVEWYELPKYRLERGLGDAISCIVNEAAEAFIVHTKELINVLAAQDLSGEGIRTFVRKVFNLDEES